MDTLRYILRRTSPSAPSPDDLATTLLAEGDLRILDRGSHHLFVLGACDADRLAKLAPPGWSVTPEQRFALPDTKPRPARPPGAARPS